MLKEIRSVCVAGAGQMGRQIALQTALHGFRVCLTDSAPSVLEDVGTWLTTYLEGRLAKGKLTRQQADAALGRFSTTPELREAVEGADLIVEAVVEDRAVKEALFREINGMAAQDAILASNSSYIPSSAFAALVDNPQRLANLHYFYPALVMELVEVVRGPHTSEETVEALMGFARDTGKYPVLIRKEIDGFIVNRILRAVRTEAMNLLEQDIATTQEIDVAVEKGLGYPMGPFRLMDQTGIDLTFLASRRMLEEEGLRAPGYDILREKYEAGEWGKKTGKGWYDYSGDDRG